MQLGIPKETRTSEPRVAMTPDIVKRLKKKGMDVLIEKAAGDLSGFSDEDYVREGALLGDASSALGSDFVCKINRPLEAEVAKMKKGAFCFSLLEPHLNDGLVEKFAHASVNAFALELIPRTSRAQTMDVLSSQANIAGYRAVLEAAYYYRRFFPLMMTSAGSSKAENVFILGVGVAGLQAIATAKRLGASVEAYDVRPEVKEQILSLGGKPFEVNLEESVGSAGGYAKELSEAGKAKLQAALRERLMKSDIIISTASVPGKKAPLLVPEEVVRGMRRGSVIVDMAAPSGGNCSLTEADRVVEKHGVTLVGTFNLPGKVAADASSFFARNIFSLLSLILKEKEGKTILDLDLNDDIISSALVTYEGKVRWKRS